MFIMMMNANMPIIYFQYLHTLKEGPGDIHYTGCLNK